MPTAVLLVEIVIIGLFASLNLGLWLVLLTPVGPLLASQLAQVWQLLASKEGIAPLGIFGAVLISYVAGVIVNVIASNLFDPIDDGIREEVFNTQTRTSTVVFCHC